MSDYSTFNEGGSSYPLAQPSPNTLLRDADPAVFYALEFFQSVLNTYLGSRLSAAATAAGVAIPTAVVLTAPIDPSPYLFQANNGFRFPLLCISRKTARYKQLTAAWEHETGIWGISYVLPQMGPQPWIKLSPILHAVEQTIMDRLTQGHDPAYAPTPPAGGLSVLDDQVWSAKYAGLQKISLTESRFGRYEDASGTAIFHSWEGTLEVQERKMPETDFQLFQGADIREAIQPVDGTPIINDVVDVRTDTKVPGPG